MFSLPFTAESSISISKPVSEVFARVADFNIWATWSPWFCQEPECELSIAGEPASVGHRQVWNGVRIGAGEMILQAVNPDSGLDYELNFFKPWKSRNKVGFTFAPDGDSTRVTWTMTGALPLFLFFMKSKLSAFVRADFDRGLLMLKDLLETGEVLSRTEIHAETERSGFYYIGKQNHCPIPDIGAAMKKDFRELGELIEAGKMPAGDSGLVIYRNYDPVKGACGYIAGFAYPDKPAAADLPDLATGRMEDHKALHIAHLGAYRHLGNGWATAVGYQRHLKKKLSKTVDMYELYVNAPGEVEEKDLLTDIYIPIK